MPTDTESLWTQTLLMNREIDDEVWAEPQWAQCMEDKILLPGQIEMRGLRETPFCGSPF